LDLKTGDKEPMSKVDLIVHPIRIRILMALAGRRMTPLEIAATMPDVPQTSLYRHINALAEGGILTIVAENPIRGTVERVYELKEGAGHLTEADVATLSKDDHLRYFIVFLSSILQDFSSYLEKQESTVPLGREVLYSKLPLHLSDTERTDLLIQFDALLQPYRNNEADGERRRYILASVVIPEEIKDPH
jgi:DNA-binding transcriptional ArsR family regulator